MNNANPTDDDYDADGFFENDQHKNNFGGRFSKNKITFNGRFICTEVLFNDIDLIFKHKFYLHACGHYIWWLFERNWLPPLSLFLLSKYIHMSVSYKHAPEWNKKKRAKGEILYCVHCIRVQWNGVAFFFVSIEKKKFHLH